MRVLPLVAMVAVALAPAVVHAEVSATADPDRPTLLRLADDGSRDELPLVRGQVHVDVRGPIGQVVLTQTFANPSETPIEAIYVFPLPDDAAVGGLTLRVGSRTIRAEIRRRDEARAIYEQAKAEGKTAALLEQERPNVFTQTVANILPGEEIDVALTYDVLLAPVAGQYELAIPTVVGPRYSPPQVTDAAAIGPPVVEPGTLSGNTLVVDLDVEAGLPIVAIDSPTHAITATTLDQSHVQVALADGDAVADRDFVLRWTVSVDKPAIAVLADKQAGAALGHLALILQPPAVVETVREPRELVFVVDTSGSMDGEPLALAKRAMRWALERLDPGDAFRILNFSTDVSGFDDGEVVAATRANVRRGLSWVNGMVSEGGTEMIRGIEAALPGLPADDRTRYVCFMTDGYIGNEDEILAAVKARLDDRTYLFSFGVGSSVNRFLLDGLAEQGRGVARYLLLEDEPAPQIEAFFAQVEAPLLGDLTVDWDGLDVVDPAPATIGPLFAGQPVVLSARYRAGGKGTVEVHGLQGGRRVTLRIPVRLPDEGGDGDVLGRLWARRAIAELSSEALGGADVTDQITQIALEHALMSATTSFVAVEERPRADGRYDTVEVPVDLPAGVSSGATITSAYVQNVPIGGRTFESVLSTAAGSQGEVIEISERAPIIDVTSTTLGVTIRGSSSAENTYAVDGVNTTALAWGTPTKRWRGTLDVLLGHDRHSGRLGGLSGAFERRLLGRLAAGLAATLWDREEAETMLAVLATLTRWSIGGAFDLRLGLGGAFTGGDAGLAAEVRLALPLPLGDHVHPELELRLDAARTGDAPLLGTALGLGVRF